MSKLTEILKTAAEYCTLGAGVATIIISVVGAVVFVPILVTLVVAAGVGLVCALAGGYHEHHRLQEETEQTSTQHHQQEQIYREFKQELDEIKHDLESKPQHRTHHHHKKKEQSIKLQFFLHQQGPLFHPEPTMLEAENSRTPIMVNLRKTN